jgi:hypothetical protein
LFWEVKAGALTGADAFFSMPPVFKVTPNPELTTGLKAFRTALLDFDLPERVEAPSS